MFYLVSIFSKQSPLSSVEMLKHVVAPALKSQLFTVLRPSALVLRPVIELGGHHAP
jgi:hypothetical protein